MAYYAVKAGRKPGIYQTWSACKAQVHGYKGAIFKKFDTEEAAVKFMEGPDQVFEKAGGGPAQGGPSSEQESSEDFYRKLSPGAYIAYVDGSYNQKKKTAGYGVVLFSAAGKECFCGEGKTASIASRNVAGEILAAETAMKEVHARGGHALTIYYDYAGIRHWALGEWRAKLPLTQSYQRLAQEMGEALHLSFVKVEAHTGVAYNEEADRLAKQGCGLADRSASE